MEMCDVDTQKLLETILDVHKQYADDVCWMDIDRIFKVCGLPVPDRTVGDKAAMKANCDKFINTMCSGGTWKSYAELEAENKYLRNKLSSLLGTSHKADHEFTSRTI